MLTIDGLNSGLDTEKIIKGLLDIQQTRIDRLTLRKQSALNKQAAFRSLEAQIVQFRSAASRLGQIQNNVFEARTVDVSDETALIASASSDATNGIYQLSVKTLAQAHQLASQGFADSEARITQGTLTIRRGSGLATNITIDGTNDTMQGLADSINLSEIGISASIVQDGSASGASARLLLTSSKTGEANAIAITNSLASSGSGAVKPEFDIDNPVQAATNAEVQLGSGPGAITVETQENHVTDLISGVSLDLLQADADRTITIRVGQNSQQGVEAVEDFVDSYNVLMSFVDDQTRFVPDSGDAGLLLGDRSMIQIQSEIQSALQSVVPGVSSRASRLSSIGISVNDNGKLTLSTARLQRAIQGEVDGIQPRDLRRLFALDAASSNSNIQFVLGSSRTRESIDPIQIDITRAAERAAVTSANSVAASTVIDSSNNALVLTVDNAVLSVTLKEGTYSPAELAAELEAVINSHPDTLGRSVSIGLQDDGFGSNSLIITSNTYGGSSQVSIGSGTALADLGFSGLENDQGVDVAGSFLVNGTVEEATGRGRLLSGLSNNTNTADLQVRVTMTAAQVAIGTDAELRISRGVASRIDQLTGDFLNSETGVLKSISDKFTTDAGNIQNSIDRQTEIFDKQEQELIAQFVALEQALGELESTKSFLTQQFNSLSNLRTGKN